tara:strand:- start:1142 stop:1363 length:222 start_codon:yes stop_codon:yes gene_type:complete
MLAMNKFIRSKAIHYISFVTSLWVIFDFSMFMIHFVYLYDKNTEHFKLERKELIQEEVSRQLKEIKTGGVYIP